MSVKNIFRQLLKSKKINVEMVFEGENRIELFLQPIIVLLWIKQRKI